MANPALDPKTPKENALSAIAMAGSDSERLISLWLDHKNAGALLEVSTHGTGSARKAARRALKVLKSRGVSIPKPRRVAKLGGALGDQSHKAWLLAPDPAFNTLIVLGKGSPTTRWRAALVFLNQGYGVAQVQQGEFSQSGLKKAIESVAPGLRYKPTEVDITWARARIHQALAAQRARGLIEPLGLTSIADLLEAPPAAAVPHPFDSEGLEVSLDDAREMSSASGELHALPEFRAWLPARAATQEMLADVGKELTPGEQPEQAQMQKMLAAAVVRATDRFFTPEERERLVVVMKDSALSVLAREGETVALKVAATMQCIQNAGLITNPPSEIPFLRAFFDKAVAYLLAQGKGSLQIPVPAAPPQSVAQEPNAEFGETPLARASATSASDTSEGSTAAAAEQPEKSEP